MFSSSGLLSLFSSKVKAFGCIDESSLGSHSLFLGIFRLRKSKILFLAWNRYFQTPPFKLSRFRRFILGFFLRQICEPLKNAHFFYDLGKNDQEGRLLGEIKNAF